MITSHITDNTDACINYRCMSRCRTGLCQCTPSYNFYVDFFFRFSYVILSSVMTQVGAERPSRGRQNGACPQSSLSELSITVTASRMHDEEPVTAPPDVFSNYRVLLPCRELMTTTHCYRLRLVLFPRLFSHCQSLFSFFAFSFK